MFLGVFKLSPISLKALLVSWHMNNKVTNKKVCDYVGYRRKGAKK